MNEERDAEGGSLPLSGVVRVDQACLRFEAACKACAVPRIEDYLGKAEGVEVAALLQELILLDIAYRKTRGEAPHAQDYLQRFPDLNRAWLEGALRAALPAGQGDKPASRKVGSSDTLSAAHADGAVSVPGLDSGTADGRPFPRPEGYEILEELGRGGMGVVYKARQKGTEQLVALKIMRPDWVGRLGADARREAVEQFHREVKAAARLRHPNRVRILLLGEHEGRPFYAMELVEGCSLAERAKRPEGVSKGAAVKYLASVAEAVHEAHQHGILHCDLKPHNILIDERTDEALLTDFGLAKMGGAPPPDSPGSDKSVRDQDRLRGTLPYMSPEATRDADAVTEASDVYSLGATLYELLTGRPPFQGESRAQLVEKICYERPAPPRAHRPDVSRRIERICLKCLEKDLERRYPTALEFAGALRLYLQEIRHARNFTTMGTLLLGLALVVLLINLAVYVLLQVHFWEPAVWAVMYSAYLALFGVFLMAPPKEAGQESRLSRREMWWTWGGVFFGAISAGVAFRLAFWQEPERALVLVYLVIAALSGMADYIVGGKMHRLLHLFMAVGWWLVALLMAFRLEWSPILYGVYAMITVMVYGVYLRQLGRELR